MHYPLSRIVKKLVGADLQRIFALFSQALESGETEVLPNVATLRAVETDSYTLGAEPIVVTGVGVFQWDPSSAVADNGSTVIRPTVGAAATGNGRWVRPTPSTQVVGVGTPGTKLFALADHVHPMTPAGVETGLAAYIPMLDYTADATGAEVVVMQPVLPYNDMVEINIKIRLIARAQSDAGDATVRIRSGGTIDTADGTVVATQTVPAAALTLIDFNATIAKPAATTFLKVTLQSSGAAVNAQIGEIGLSVVSAP